MPVLLLHPQQDHSASRSWWLLHLYHWMAVEQFAGRLGVVAWQCSAWGPERRGGAGFREGASSVHASVLQNSREQFLGPEHDYVACECCYYKVSSGPDDPGWAPGFATNWWWNDANAPHKHLLDARGWASAKQAYLNEEQLLASGACAW